MTIFTIVKKICVQGEGDTKHNTKTKYIKSKIHLNIMWNRKAKKQNRMMKKGTIKKHTH